MYLICRSGCCIEAVKVKVSHAIDKVRSYIVRRVVFKDKNASIVFKEIQLKCKRYGCKERIDEEVSGFPCLQVVNERFHFAALTEKELNDLMFD